MAVFRTSWVDQEHRQGLVPSGWTLIDTGDPDDECYIDVRPDGVKYTSGVALRFTTDSSNGLRMVSRDGGSAANQQVLALFETSKLVTSGPYGYVLGRFTNADNNYRAYLVSDDTFRVGRWVGGVFFGLGDAAFAWSTNTKYWILLECVGTTIRGKVWANGSPEPGSWMVSATDASHAEGTQGVGIFNGIGSSDGSLFHEVRIGTAADPAPRGFGSPRRPVLLSAASGEIAMKPFNLGSLQTATGTAPSADARVVSHWRLRAGVALSPWVSASLDPPTMTIPGLTPGSTVVAQMQLRDTEGEEGDWSGEMRVRAPSLGRAVTGADFTEYADSAALQAEWPVRWTGAGQTLTLTVNDGTFRCMGVSVNTAGNAAAEWTRVPLRGPYRVRWLCNWKTGTVKEFIVLLTGTSRTAPPARGVMYRRTSPGTLAVVRMEPSGSPLFDLEDSESAYPPVGSSDPNQHFWLEGEYDEDAGLVRGRVYREWEAPPAWQVEFASDVDGLSTFPFLGARESFATYHVMAVEWEHDFDEPVALGIVSGVTLRSDVTFDRGADSPIPDRTLHSPMRYSR